MTSPNHTYEHHGRDKVVGNEEFRFRMPNHAVSHAFCTIMYSNMTWLICHRQSVCLPASVPAGAAAVYIVGKTQWQSCTMPAAIWQPRAAGVCTMFFELCLCSLSSREMKLKCVHMSCGCNSPSQGMCKRPTACAALQNCRCMCVLDFHNSRSIP